MKSDTKNILKITGIIILIIGVLVSIYLIKNKYDKVEILSLKQEYNLIFENSEDTINIPLYFKRDNSYLSRNSQIESVSLSNSSTTLKGKLRSVTTGSTATYKDNTYYEFIFSVSFPLYDDFSEPLFLSDCNFNIKYQNGNTLSFDIGNVNVLFNTNINNRSDIKIVSLSAVTNEVNNILTIVGINISLNNISNKEVILNSIKINNKYYELDYMNYKLDKIDSKKVLVEDEQYSYYMNSINNGVMNLNISRGSKIEIFIPLKYLSNIYSVNNIPLYIEYEIDGEHQEYIQDDFTFFNRINPLSLYEVKSYVYSY